MRNNHRNLAETTHYYHIPAKGAKRYMFIIVYTLMGIWFISELVSIVWEIIS